MLKKRVIFVLLYDRGMFMLSRNFRLQKVGNLNWLQKNYNFAQIAFSIDELVILDVSRGDRNEDTFIDHIRSLATECFVPIAVGGGIRSIEQARRFLHSGADKVVINSLFGIAPEIVTQIASEFGQQCIIASVDTKHINDGYTVWTENGTKLQEQSLSEWLKRITKLPVGELFLNSIDRDGTGQGYNMDLLDSIPKNISTPVIMLGGAGKFQHLAIALDNVYVDAAATAHLFNFVGDGLEKTRQGLCEKGLDLALWDRKTAKELKGTLTTKVHK